MIRKLNDMDSAMYRILLPAMIPDERYFLDALKKKVEAWEINDGAAYMITRIEVSGDTCEFVVCCFAGHGLLAAAPYIIDMARECRAQSIRFHTRRRGIGRMMSAFGFAEREKIFALEL